MLNQFALIFSSLWNLIGFSLSLRTFHVIINNTKESFPHTLSLYHLSCEHSCLFAGFGIFDATININGMFYILLHAYLDDYCYAKVQLNIFNLFSFSFFYLKQIICHHSERKIYRCHEQLSASSSVSVQSRVCWRAQFKQQATFFVGY